MRVRFFTQYKAFSHFNFRVVKVIQLYAKNYTYKMRNIILDYNQKATGVYLIKSGTLKVDIA